MNENEVIRIDGLFKKYKKIQAVNGLNLTVHRGDIYGFLGPNGAGKSTTIRMITGLIYPSAGSITLFGKTLQQARPAIFSKFGALIEKPDFYNYLSAYKNLEILGKISGIQPTRNLIMQTLEKVNLHKRFDSKVKTFSHGMKQRLGLAQVLLHDPDLIILDEPGNGLDPQSTKELRDSLVDLNRNFGKTIFLSSHILHEIEQIATRMVIINKGQTVIEGRVEDLLNSGELQITFEVDNIPKAMQILSENFSAIEVRETLDKKLTVKAEKAFIPLINKQFVEQDVNVLSIVPLRSLEEYFLNITDNS
jgi:ABC-type multidrug transport system ATPase subunit